MRLNLFVLMQKSGVMLSDRSHNTIGLKSWQSQMEERGEGGVREQKNKISPVTCFIFLPFNSTSTLRTRSTAEVHSHVTYILNILILGISSIIFFCSNFLIDIITITMTRRQQFNVKFETNQVRCIRIALIFVLSKVSGLFSGCY